VRLNLDFPLPPPWVRGVLLLAFLGFGVFVGSATSRPDAKLAAAQPTVRLMLPAAAPQASQGATTTPPPVTPEATPEASGASTAASTTTTSTSATTTSSAAAGGEGAAGGGAGGEGGSGSATKLPAVKHVFVIVLADEPYAAVFGPASKARYLAQTLERRGTLLVRYYAVAHDELANAITLVSGQGPTAQTASNCPTFADLQPGSAGADGQVLGSGCVYPRTTPTLAAQLAAKHLTWKAYVEGMGAGACAHPALGSADATVGPAPSVAPGSVPAGQAPPANAAVAGIPYTTFRNPFVYFHGVIDSPSACAARDVGLDKLSADLTDAKRTPSFSYIVPSLCDDASPVPCAPGKPAGVVAADAFLRKVVPEILASKAYRSGGLLAITVDQAPASGIEADSSSCCGQPRFPGLPAPAPLPGAGASSTALPPSGGGQVGALLLSPFVKGGTVDQDPYNHFSLLRTIEDVFGLAHLGYAGAAGASSFGASVFAGGAGG
jgi:hypothetical protein